MEVSDLPQFSGGVVYAIGVFDGVHRGHQLIVQEMRRLAQQCAARAVALTFDPHPRAVLQPQTAPRLLIPLEERCRRLRQAGADEVRVISFNRSLAALPPEDFLDSLLEGEAKLRGICVGSNWHFGAKAAGNAALIARRAEGNFHFRSVPELELDGEIVSSTAIRQRIAAGDLNGAAQFLGTPCKLYGVVEHGFQDAANVLKHPTANLNCGDCLLPPDGVYAVRVSMAQGVWIGAMNVGLAPTFARENPVRRLEIHLLDFAGDLYGAPLEVELLRYLRQERKFSDPMALKAQIELDVKEIRAAASGSCATGETI
ncbi:MAG: riboflavin biosynthesis protein RibF [Lentisphaeria bacterium]|nr:riboflavin biosynthesis protein RibF [Lentisphaeria bacterium]